MLMIPFEDFVYTLRLCSHFFARNYIISSSHLLCCDRLWDAWRSAWVSDEQDMDRELGGHSIQSESWAHALIPALAQECSGYRYRFVRSVSPSYLYGAGPSRPCPGKFQMASKGSRSRLTKRPLFDYKVMYNLDCSDCMVLPTRSII